METPVCEEFHPKGGCYSPGCVQRRRFTPGSSRSRPAGRPSVRRFLMLAAAVGTILGTGHVVPAAAATYGSLQPGPPSGEGVDTPQGQAAPLHGPGGKPAPPKTPTTTRTEIISRARKWIDAQVPYSMSDYWSDGYRQDCSGFVSMAWNLGSNEWTGSLDKFGDRISKEGLQPGDILLFHNPDNPEKGSHVVLFGGWSDYTHTYYVAYEETPPSARRQTTPYAYWANSDRYVPYRYKGVVESKGTEGKGAPIPTGAQAPTWPPVPFPGAASFGQGADNAYVTQLRRLLVARGGARFYAADRRPHRNETDRHVTDRHV